MRMTVTTTMLVGLFLTPTAAGAEAITPFEELPTVLERMAAQDVKADEWRAQADAVVSDHLCNERHTATKDYVDCLEAERTSINWQIKFARKYPEVTAEAQILTACRRKWKPEADPYGKYYTNRVIVTCIIAEIAAKRAQAIAASP